jgi:anti-sigma factor RsiW
MTCDRYRRQLALLVGNDLDPREASDVRQHLIACPGCQAHWNSLQASTNVLYSVSHQSAVRVNGTLWPAIRAKVAARPTVLSETAPSWFTLSAFAAVCAAVVWFTLSTPVFDFDLNTVEVADIEAGRETARPASHRFPELHFVDDAQPPVQIFPEGDAAQRMPMPPSSFGEPRSF